MPKTNNIPHKGGNPSRELLYATAAKHAPEAIKILLDLMRNGDNDNVKMASAKTILAKAIPDLRSTEITGKDGEPININLINDYISPLGWANATPKGDIKGQDTVQGTDLAQASKENLDSAGKSSA